MTDAVNSIRHDWTTEQIKALFDLPFNDLLFRAQTLHRENFDANAVQISTLLSIKTGACPEDCSYCPQSAKYDTGLERERLLPLEEVREAAQNAKQNGATRFCMGAAWRNPTDKNLDRVIEMINVVRDLGMETCVTLGMLTREQTRRLKDAGEGFYTIGSSGHETNAVFGHLLRVSDPAFLHYRSGAFMAARARGRPEPKRSAKSCARTRPRL